jgi:4-amino-4-deoxy-L-arabinose transferase-like glycosyltransferase
MSVATPIVGTMRVRTHALRWSVALSAVAMYAVGLVGQLMGATVVNNPLSEGSSYYVAVARNLVEGHGLTVDAIWNYSYATPPVTFPRPAFELWQPMASFVMALPMALFGTAFDVGQIGFALLGAFLAPLAWLVARDAASRLELPERRAQAVTHGAGVLTAISAPLLLAGAAPDSTLPFAVAGVSACLVVPRAVGGDRVALVAVGVALGLAYLTRMEAVWLGVAFLIAVYLATHSVRRAAMLGLASGAVAALVAAPWWLRNLSVFGTPLPGQLADNAFLTRNEQIFAYLDRPTLEGFLSQGPARIAGNVGNAFWHDLVDVLLVSAGPIAAVGLLTVLIGLRRRGVRPTGALAVLLGAGAITFVATSVLFPVATVWGTFEHAAGPLQVGLIVAALIGADAFVARIRTWRDWPRANAWLAPAGLALIGLPIAALALAGAASSANANAQRPDHLCSQPRLGDRPWRSGHRVIHHRSANLALGRDWPERHRLAGRTARLNRAARKSI